MIPPDSLLLARYAFSPEAYPHASPAAELISPPVPTTRGQRQYFAIAYLTRAERPGGDSLQAADRSHPFNLCYSIDVMIPKECRRLAEVDFPIAIVSAHAVGESSGGAGHPFTLHKWWARRPLASSRALLLALLLPDPCDVHCPRAFKRHAPQILSAVRQRPRNDEQLRKALLWFIGAFADWHMAAHPTHLQVARHLVKAAHNEEVPLVVDSFAGGGSIPLEALRLGCDTFASDLNPVACLLLKVLLEEIPRAGSELAPQLRRAGEDVQAAAETELSDLYPTDPDGARPIAYLWARTVRCEAPNCGAEIPIFRSPWLAKKGASRARYFREMPHGKCSALLISSNPIGGPVVFRIATGDGSQRAKPGYTQLSGTKAKGNTANVVCPCCKTVLPGTKSNSRVQNQLAAQNGGADVLLGPNGHRLGGARLLAVVTIRPGQAGRHYRLPHRGDYAAVARAHARLAEVGDGWLQGAAQPLRPIPDESLPPIGTLGFRVQRYGVRQWGDLFTARQKVALATLQVLVRDHKNEKLRSLLACAFDRVSMSGMSCTSSPWKKSRKAESI